jgi:uroporphyrinogen decarboxylase
MNQPKHRFLAALRRQPVDKTPIWIMRQAGRYLPEYRQVRQQAGNFLALCQNPKLACEVTMQPLRRFDLDAAILFSDILTIPDAMGLGLHFTQGEGPKFHRAVTTQADIAALPTLDTATQLSYVLEAVDHIKTALNDRLPLIGFSGSPWTLATYMVEGGASKEFLQIKKMLYGDPQTLHLLLQKLSDAVVDYLAAQIKAGVDAVQIFDTWGGVLTTPHYQQFSLQYLQNIVQRLQAVSDVPIILFTKGGGQWLPQIAKTGAAALGVDWTWPIETAFAQVGDQVALQGNLDPAALLGTPAQLKIEAENILRAVNGRPGHIFNLGHGISQHVDPQQVQVLVEAVHGYKH